MEETIKITIELTKEQYEDLKEEADSKDISVESLIEDYFSDRG